MGLGFSKAECLLLIPAGSGETVEKVRHGRKEHWGLDSTGTSEEKPRVYLLEL